MGTDMQKDTVITDIISVNLNDDKVNKAIKIGIDKLTVNGEDWIQKYGGYIDIGLYDTMYDLLDGIIGASVFSISRLYLFKKKQRDKGVKMKFANKIQKFMYGRYGSDDLYKFLFKLYICLFIISIFVRNNILVILELVTITIMFYRFFSKNIYKRSNENQKFIKTRNKILKPFENIKRNYKDKDHIYKRCHKCKTTLKLPLPMKRGFKHAKCPHCGKKVTLFAFKYQKVEIIRNNYHR